MLSQAGEAERLSTLQEKAIDRTRKARSRAGLAARLFARCAVVAAIAAVVVLLLALGGGGLLVVMAGILGLVVCAAGIWWLVARRGLVRLLGAFLAVAAPAGVLVFYARSGLWLTALISSLCWATAVTCGRTALHRARPPRSQRPVRARPPRRAVLIMNPKSGGGKVTRFDLVKRAERLGARVILLDPSAPVDVGGLAREAVEDGADLLGVAGGDGTQALVGAVAAEHGLSFLVISAGTRNHFAMDLGLDRADPARCLDALTDGEEIRVEPAHRRHLVEHRRLREPRQLRPHRHRGGPGPADGRRQRRDRQRRAQHLRADAFSRERGAQYI